MPVPKYSRGDTVYVRMANGKMRCEKITEIMFDFSKTGRFLYYLQNTGTWFKEDEIIGVLEYAENR